MSKCDFCDAEATSFGSYAIYQACKSHEKMGLEIESKFWDSMPTQDEMDQKD